MNTSGIKEFVGKYWHQLIIVLILVFVLLKKDLSFQLRLKAPVGKEQAPAREEQVPAKEPSESPAPERLSEHQPKDGGGSEAASPQLDHFDLSSIRKGGSPKVSATKELARIDEQRQQAFMERFAHVTVSERKKYGIPSSLIMANSLLLSRAGQRDMTQSGNNYFALPCTADWQGRRGTYQSSCYRHYKNAWMSFRDHSLYLTTGRLTSLRRLDPDDYRAWARGLEKAGFYEEPKMADQVIGLIESYRLYELDRQ